MPALRRLRSPMDFMDGRLVGAFDDHFVDANVRRTAGGPDQRFGDVFGGERVDTFIDFLRAFGVAFDTDDGEFRFSQTRIDGADAHAGAGQFYTECVGDFEFDG